MPRRLRNVALIPFILAVGIPAFASAPRNGVWLFTKLATQARSEEKEARAAGRTSDAATWQEWAKEYDSLAADPRAEDLSALALSRSNIEFNRTLARQAKQSRNEAALALYEASAKMWTDLAADLAGQKPVTVRFPAKEMLTPVPGLPGTPWAGAKQPGAETGAGETDCRALAERARACEKRQASIVHDGIVSGDGASDFAVVQRTQCDRAEELYAARCLGAGAP